MSTRRHVYRMTSMGDYKYYLISPSGRIKNDERDDDYNNWKRYKKAKGRPIQIMETYDKFINLEKTHELFYGNKYAFNNETQGFDYSKVKHKHIKNKKL